MNVEKAIISFGEKQFNTIEFEGGSLIDLAHHLILISQPKLEIKLTEERKTQFVIEASNAYVKSSTAWDAVEFTKLYVEMATEKYFAIERANHAYNLAVLAYEEKLKVFKERSDIFVEIQNAAFDFLENENEILFIDEVLTLTSAQ